MKRMLALLLLCLQVAGARPAFAWDPFGVPALDEGPPDPPDPAPFVVPRGLYSVNEVYAGDVVTTAGDTTVYSTATIRDDPGTYARIVDVVSTGRTSPFDGASFNGRGRLPDDRPVAGTYYENFVLTASGYVSVSFVFFQDDTATRAAAVPSTAPATSPAPPARSSTPLPGASPTTPGLPTPTSAPAPLPTARPLPVVTAGVALAPAAPVLTSLEVLRGRATRLWLRAFVDGTAVPVTSWRFTGGTVDSAIPAGGAGSGPCEVTWLTLAPPGAALTLRFAVETGAAPGRTLEASIRVSVRSPALLE